MLAAFTTLPTWLLVLVCAVAFSLVTFGTRWIVRRRCDADRQDDLVELAGAMNGPTGTTLAFLIGFAVTITWGAMSAAQGSIEKVAASAQQMSWLTENLEDRATAKSVNDDLNSYLLAIVNQDRGQLASGDIVQLPSFDYLDKLERDIRAVGKSGATANPESSQLLTAASALTGAQAELNAVARRQLPTVVLWLLLFTATLSAAVMGIVATKVSRPYLILGWAIVAATGICVVLSLYNPFDGTVSVDFQPLADAAARIAVNAR
ncbi:MAG: DUF4239 domain-containing protein [Actinobacteria bacterium]|nr:MAG: DUF4239 domain-containing protein [Actinomycetota bacterium]